MTWVSKQLVLVTFVAKLERILLCLEYYVATRTAAWLIIIKSFNLYEISVGVLICMVIILLINLRDNYFLNCPFQMPRLYCTLHVSIFQAIRDEARQLMEIPGS